MPARLRFGRLDVSSESPSLSANLSDAADSRRLPLCRDQFLNPVPMGQNTSDPSCAAALGKSKKKTKKTQLRWVPTGNDATHAELEDGTVPEVFVSIFICCFYRKLYFPEVICCAAVVGLQ